MAPGANIHYVGAKSCNNVDFIPALNDLVDGHKADIVSNSYGNRARAPRRTGTPRAASSRRRRSRASASTSRPVTAATRATPATAARSRPPTSRPPRRSSPQSGGTSLGVDATGDVVLERGWTTGVSGFDPATNTYTPGPRGDFLYGAGGGASRVFPQPDYQKGVVPNNLATSVGTPKRRVVPDVGMVGDPNTGFLVGQTQTFPEGVSYDEYRIGGTSAARRRCSPAIMALADQQAGAHHGFANPFLYSLAGSSAFRDIKPGPKSAVARRNYANNVDAERRVRQPVGPHDRRRPAVPAHVERLRHPDRAGRPERRQLRRRRVNAGSCPGRLFRREILAEREFSRRSRVRPVLSTNIGGTPWHAPDDRPSRSS